ncbi:hypothetical protein KUCAC02_032071 [Chaenocephalus aceratus]|nr:hypothetical protein KUCAC02_032071 [Chaenocephalus aceratus]
MAELYNLGLKPALLFPARLSIVSKEGDLVLAEARKVTILAESSSEDNKDEEPPAKTPRLFTGYRKKSKKKDDHVSSVKAALIRYIQVWRRQSRLPRLLEKKCKGLPKALSCGYESARCSCHQCTSGKGIQSLRPYNAPSPSQA